jgi:AcrR family transcriptional regulator
MRQIAADAKANLATAYYYFQSKEGLVEAVFRRRFEPLKAAHFELLKQYAAENGGRPLGIDKILQAMFLPALRLAETEPANHRTILRLIGRLVTEPSPVAQNFFNHFFTDVHEAFVNAFQRSAPHLSRAEVVWRIEFIWGSLTFILVNPEHVAGISKGLCNVLDSQVVMGQLIACFAPCFKSNPRGGLRAAVPSR